MQTRIKESLYSPWTELLFGEKLPDRKKTINFLFPFMTELAQIFYAVINNGAD